MNAPSILITSSPEGKLSVIISPDKVLLSGTATVSIKTTSSPATTVLPVVSATEVDNNFFSKVGETRETEAVSIIDSETNVGHASILEKFSNNHVFTYTPDACRELLVSKS